MYSSDTRTQAPAHTQVSPARWAAYRILRSWSKSGPYIDHLLSRELSRTELSPVDRNLVTELVYGVIRWQGRLDWILAQLSHGDYRRTPVALKVILRLGLYQILFLERIPAYAAVSEAVLLARQQSPAWGRLVNGLLRTYLRQPERVVYPLLEDDPVTAISVRESHPQWLVRRWLQRFGVEETRKLCEANNRRPALSLRINTLRASRDEILEELRSLGLDAREGFLPDFIRLEHGGDPSRLPAFAAGKLTVQDESAALPVLALDAQPDDTILDLCAAPGGKSTYVAERCKEKATVVAVDRDPGRARSMRESIERLQCRRVFVVVADARRFGARPADRVLVDAPCSGLGVLAKRADLRWKRKEKDLAELAELQAEMLEAAAALVRPAGVLVYSTCTIEPVENEEVVEHFLRAHPNFELEPATNWVAEEFTDSRGYIQTWPHVHGMDGSFAARLRRKK